MRSQVLTIRTRTANCANPLHRRRRSTVSVRCLFPSQRAATELSLRFVLNRAGLMTRVPRLCAGVWGSMVSSTSGREWFDNKWTPCSKKCGTGSQSQEYKIKVQAAHGGKACEFKDGKKKLQDCNKDDCSKPINCKTKPLPWTKCKLEKDKKQPYCVRDKNKYNDAKAKTHQVWVVETPMQNKIDANGVTYLSVCLQCVDRHPV